MAEPRSTTTAAVPEFKPYIPDSATIPEFTPRAVILGMLFGIIFGAVTVYVGLRAGPDRLRLDPDRGPLDQPAAGPGPGDHPREQHRPDHGIGGRGGGGRRHLHPARAHLPGLPARVLAHLPALPHRRVAGRAVHDPAAPPAHGQGARQPAVPGGRGLRRRPDRRREGRVLREPRLLRARPRRRLHAVPERERAGRHQPGRRPTTRRSCPGPRCAPPSPPSTWASATSSGRRSRA